MIHSHFYWVIDRDLLKLLANSIQTGPRKGRQKKGLTMKKVTPEPTITSITVPIDYTRTLVAMRDAGKCDGYVDLNLNDANFSVGAGQGSEYKLIYIICFHRDIGDNEDPAKSKLLEELGKLGFQPEGPAESCAVGEHHPDLQRQFPIVARRQVWRDPRGVPLCPILRGDSTYRSQFLHDVRYGWRDDCRFLASRKPVANGDSK